MNIKKQWVKPVMVTENFTPDEYVAICAVSTPQFLYMDGIRRHVGAFGIVSYRSGSDGVFQDESHASGLQAILNLILSLFTGRDYDTNGEFTGTLTTDHPSKKGEVVKANWLGDYPIYGSPTQLSDGDSYPGPDLRGSLKKNDNNEYYIQGNMS